MALISSLDVYESHDAIANLEFVLLPLVPYRNMFWRFSTSCRELFTGLSEGAVIHNAERYGADSARQNAVV
jgi:hypothetical protein